MFDNMNTDDVDNSNSEEDPLLLNIRQVARLWYDQIVQEDEQHEYYFGDLATMGTSSGDHSSDAFLDNQQRSNNKNNATPAHLLQDLRRMIQPHPTLPTNVTENSPVAADLRSGMILTLKYWYDMAVLRQTYNQRMAEQDVPYCSQQVREWMKEYGGATTTTTADTIPPNLHNKAHPAPHVVVANQAPSPTDVKQLFSPLDTTTTTTNNNSSSTTTKPLSLERTHHLLATLYHGKKCRGGPSCTFDSCQRARALWNHVVACPNNNVHPCPMPWCAHSRQALHHYHTCTGGRMCPICGPVQQAMPQLQRTLGGTANSKKRLTTTRVEMGVPEGQVL